jgi:hypothetical protein
VNTKPQTYQRDLTKLPRALAPLIERPQWCVWRWTQNGAGSWQKPPFQAKQPDRHASTTDPGTWATYPEAIAAVQAGHADGITYILTENDPLAAIDLDHCRNADTGSIAAWCQNFIGKAGTGYVEVTPSGEGVRIWGTAAGECLNRKFGLEIDGKNVGVELFRRTNKALTVTGHALNGAAELSNVDRVVDWAVTWGERRKATQNKAHASSDNGFDSSGTTHSIDEIDKLVREGAPAGGDRSALFHTVVGHFHGCGWDAERIVEHLEQYPNGVAGRYLAEGRLAQEVARSLGKYETDELPQMEAPPAQPAEAVEEDVEQDVDEDLEDETDDEPLEGEEAADLPKLFSHGDLDRPPIKSWLIKGLIPEIGAGLLAGQWGSGKTFMFLELAAAVMTGQPLLGRMVKRQCGVLLFAAEAASDVTLRLDALVREKCGNAARVPFSWYETVPTLLEKGAATELVKMCRTADQSFRERFGLPLGLVGVDTIAASAGYRRAGDESDPAVGRAVLNVLQHVSRATGCFVLGVDHFGKDAMAGVRGASSKEDAADTLLVCLGERELAGGVANLRLAVRKNKGGPQGQQYPFRLRLVEAPEQDEDGEPITTMVVDWVAGAASAAPPPPSDPWAEARRQDTRTHVLRLRRVLEQVLADRGVELPIAPEGPVVRAVDQKLVQAEFYTQSPAADTAEQSRKTRYMQFQAALAWVEGRRLIGIKEVGGVTYLWLLRPEPEEGAE